MKHAVAVPWGAGADLLDLALTFLPGAWLARVPGLGAIDDLIADLVRPVADDVGRLLGRFGEPAVVRMQAADGATRRLTATAVRGVEHVLPVSAGARTVGTGASRGGTARGGVGEPPRHGGASGSMDIGPEPPRPRLTPDEAEAIVLASPRRDWSEALTLIGIDPADFDGLPPLRGEWQQVNETMSLESAAFQEQVTGHTREIGYVVDGVRINTVWNNMPVDAKGKYSHLFQADGTPQPWFEGTPERPGELHNLLEQARRHVRVARGRPAIWVFAEESVALWMSDILEARGVRGLICLFEEAI